MATNSCGGGQCWPGLTWYADGDMGHAGTLTISFVGPIVKLEEIFSSEQPAPTQRDIDIGASLAPVIFVTLSRETRGVTCDESVTSYDRAWAMRSSG